MKNNELEMFTFEQIKKEFIGEIGSEKREQYEQKLKVEMLGETLKRQRIQRNLTQEELANLVGLNRFQIARIEKNTTNSTLENILKVVNALNAKVNINIEFLNQNVKAA